MMVMNNKKSVILLSGGLDSLVSLAVTNKENIKTELAITFDYGQKAFEKELLASKKIADFYKIKHEVIKLDWLKNITNTSLVAEAAIPEVTKEHLSDKKITQESMKNVWVPNRNGLFINIAAAFCDAKEYDFVIIGANSEEAKTFSDNSKTFINSMNETLKTSTNYNVSVVAPLIDMDKDQIIAKAIEFEVPLEYINSCYSNTENHCGKCESCTRLKNALEKNNQKDLITKLFGD